MRNNPWVLIIPVRISHQNLNPRLNGRGILDFLYIFATVIFTVYGHLVVKGQVSKAGVLPLPIRERIFFLVGLVFNPWIISGLGAGFLAMLCWLAAMTKFELSYAYPFMSLAFVMVLILSALLFHESVTITKILGLMFVVAGIIIASRR